MSELLSTYEKSFRKTQDMINKNIDKITISIGESDISSSMEGLERLIDEQKKIIKQIEVEISSSVKKEDYDGFNTKISMYKSNLEMNRKKFKNLEEKIKIQEVVKTTDKKDLSGDLIKNEQLAYAGNQKLQEAKRVLANAEDMGNKIMANMDEQTNTMKNTNTKLKGMNVELDESNNVLNKMKSRLKKNKKIVCYLSVTFIVILFLVATYKFLKK